MVWGTSGDVRILVQVWRLVPAQGMYRGAEINIGLGTSGDVQILVQVWRLVPAGDLYQREHVRRRADIGTSLETCTSGYAQCTRRGVTIPEALQNTNPLQYSLHQYEPPPPMFGSFSNFFRQ